MYSFSDSVQAISLITKKSRLQRIFQLHVISVMEFFCVCVFLFFSCFVFVFFFLCTLPLFDVPVVTNKTRRSVYFLRTTYIKFRVRISLLTYSVKAFFLQICVSFRIAPLQSFTYTLSALTMSVIRYGNGGVKLAIR